jgi:uncharacterized membrane protein
MSTKREHLSNTVAALAHPGGVASDTVVADATPGQRGDTPGSVRATEERSAVVVVPVPASAATPQAPAIGRSPAPGQRSAVHVAPNIRELIAATPIETPQETQVAKERRDLNEVVHGVLIIGLCISTTLMLAGVGLDLFYQRDLPTAVPNIAEVVGRVMALRPSGFLAMGLLVLIATPILRVVGSIGAFLHERDWRFASLTTLVLAVLIVSLLLGRG